MAPTQPNYATMTSSFVSTAPGRLCLFGEHQDYLHLPVIAAALPLTCQIQVTPTPTSRLLQVNIPALDTTWRCDLDNLPPSPAEKSMDFMLSAVHEVLKDGWELPFGAKCVSTTDIPMQAGVSSSSAFVRGMGTSTCQACQPNEISSGNCANGTSSRSDSFWCSWRNHGSCHVGSWVEL